MYHDTSFGHSSSSRPGTGADEDMTDLLDTEDIESPDLDLPEDTAAIEGDVEDSDDEEDIPLAITTARRRKEAAMARKNAVLSSASKYNSAVIGKSASAAKKPRKKVEPLFITLVHGDILLFSGDNFEVCVSILFVLKLCLTSWLISTRFIELGWVFVSALRTTS